MQKQSRLNELTLDEKVSLLEGKDSWYTNPIPRFDIPSICLTDGPTGVRKATGTQVSGITMSEIATAFPTSVTVANTWNEELAYLEGKAIGRECRHYQVGLLLGPGMNIKRNPLCGRNFEYYSEDPLLTANMASSFIRGIEENQVGACPKHFACNNEENFRFMSDSIVDERALHEIYLRGFEKAIQASSPSAIMCSYNAIHGTHLSEDKALLEDTLRKDFGFKGFVITDWGATLSRVKGIEAGVDFEAPGEVIHNRNEIRKAYVESETFKEKLDQSVGRVLSFIEKVKDNEVLEPEFESHALLAQRIAEEGAVLLKNKDHSLPLRKQEKILVIGDLFEKMRYQGAGSSCLNPYRCVSPKEAFEHHGVPYEFLHGYDVCFDREDKDAEMIKDVLPQYERVLLFLGLDDYTEMEGFDRESLSLPSSQLRLVETLLKFDVPIDCVLFGGSVVELPFLDHLNSLLYLALPGEMGGEALYQLLFGHVSPSGRLSETWPLSLTDVPFADSFSKSEQELYLESIYVGYRYYATAHVPVRFPFGYGLSYVNFRHSKMKIQNRDNQIQVSVSIENLGDMDAMDVVEVYGSLPSGRRMRAERVLLGYRKVQVKAKEKKEITFEVDASGLEIYDTETKQMCLEEGDYQIMMGKSVNEIEHIETIHLSGVRLTKIQENPKYRECRLSEITEEDFYPLADYTKSNPPSKKATMETRVAEYRSLLGKMICRILVSFTGKKLKKLNQMPYSVEREIQRKNTVFVMRLMPNNCARSLCMSSGGQFTYKAAEGFVCFANGKFFRGLWKFLKKEKELKIMEVNE